jgi:hypothetical protein
VIPGGGLLHRFERLTDRLWYDSFRSSFKYQFEQVAGPAGAIPGRLGSLSGVNAHALERRDLMPEKFNGTWKIRKGRAIENLDFVTDNVESTVASYDGTSFTFRMKIDGVDVDFPATDVTDRFMIGPHTYDGKIYAGDVWRVNLFYDDDGIEILLAGVIKRSSPGAGQNSYVTDPDTVSFTAIKTGN